jgi:hypothetical protein
MDSLFTEPVLDRLVSLDNCDGYIVLVLDPDTHESDAHGPFSGIEAIHLADQFRRDFDSADLAEVEVTVTRWHRPTPTNDSDSVA